MLLKYLAYAFVLLIYGAFAWTGKVSAESFIAVLGGIIAALGATHIHAAVNSSGDASDPPPASAAQLSTSAPTQITQSGFASPFMLMLLALAITAVLLLSGCANVTQAVSAYSASAEVAAKAAEDQNIKAWTFDACATPLSTIVRHPEIAGGLKALCFSGTTSTANDLLGQIGAAKVPATQAPGDASATAPGVQIPTASGTQK